MHATILYNYHHQDEKKFYTPFCQDMYVLSFFLLYNSDGSEPRPGLGFFSGLRLELKGRVQTQLFEKGLENCSFYIIKIRGPSKLRLLA